MQYCFWDVEQSTITYLIKAPMIKNIYFVFLFIITLFFASCNDRNYPKVDDSLCIINKTDTTIYIEYGFENQLTDYYSSNRDSVPSEMISIRYLSNNTSDLWLRQDSLEKMIAKIKIYRVDNQDTIFVEYKYYSKLTQWEHTYNHFYESSLNDNRNSLTVRSEMFNK
jgi:hypothetical protein